MKLNILPDNPEKEDQDKVVGLGRFPSWLHRKLPPGGSLWQTGEILSRNRLHTVCEEAKCPNLLECWSRKTATFLVMGKACTRSCGFCDIDFSKAPAPLDPEEPARVADSVLEMGLKHVVVTMVARDDLPDGGAAHLAQIVQSIRHKVPSATIELLTSDLSGNIEALETVLKAEPDIFNHNIETVRELTPRVRHKATYERTLTLLRTAKRSKPHLLVKSGLMVGLGETEDQVVTTLKDLKQAGCDIVTIGQYLQANHRKLRVKEFVPPEQFEKYKTLGHQLGIPHLFCGPFVRSSYNADLVLKAVRDG